MYSVGTSGGMTWAMGYYGVWITENGTSWRAVPLAAGHVRFRNDQVAQVAFADLRHGWAVATYLGPPRERYAELGRTTDGGKTWTWARLDICSSLCSGEAHVSFLGASHGFLSIGWIGSSLRSALFESTDGGLTWRNVHTVPGRGPIAFQDPRHGFLTEPYITTGLGPNFGHLFRTVDSGRRWERVPIHADYGHVADAAPIVLGRTVIQLGLSTISVSGDSGATWDSRSIPLRAKWPYGYSSFSAASPTTWFVGARKRLWETTDAGRRWEPLAIRNAPGSPNANLLGLDMTSRLNGWALWGTTLFRTKDGGVHWKQAQPNYIVAKHRR